MTSPIHRDWEGKKEPGLFRYFLLLVSFLFVLYLPVLTGYYLWHDDFAVFVWDKSHFFGHPIFGFLNQLGRPLGAFFLVLITYPLDSVADGNIVRAGLVGLLAITAFLFFRLLVHLSGSCSRATPEPNPASLFLLTLFVFSLTPFNTYIAYISNGVDILGWLFGIGATFSLVRAMETEERGQKSLFLLVFIALSLAALWTYPPAAMIVFCALGFSLLFSPQPSPRIVNRKFWVYLAWAWVPPGLYIVYVQFWVPPLPDNPQLGLETDFGFKLHWFFTQVLFTAFNFWNIFPNNVLPWGVLFLIVVAIGFEMAHTAHSNSRNHRLTGFGFLFGKVLILIGLLILTIAPHFFSLKGRVITYRGFGVLFALSAIVLFYALHKILWTVFEPKKATVLLRSILFFLCGVSFYFAHAHVNNYIVGSASTELRFIKSRLMQQDLEKYRRIHLICPPRIQTPAPEKGFSFVAPYSRKDEFAFPLTSAYQYALPIMLAMIQEAGIQITQFQHRAESFQINDWRVTYSGRPEVSRFSFDEPTLFIDMNRLDHFY